MRTVTSPTNAEWKPPNTMSLFTPFAEAIRDGHRIAYNLPAKPTQADANRAFQDQLNRQQQSAAAALIAYYDRPNGNAGD